VLDRLVELRRLRLDERVDEARDRLAVVGRDLRERLPGLEVAPELRHRDAEVVGDRRRLDADPPHAEAGAGAHAEAEADPAEERELAGLDRRLDAVALGLGEPSGGYGRV